MKKIVIVLAVICAMLSSMKVYSQHDPMFTNYMWNEMFINPGYAGSREAISVVVLDREQWIGIDGAPSTQTVSIHSPFFENKIGLGFSILNEKIGVSKQTSYMGTYAYRMKTGEKGILALGLSAGAITLRENLLDVKTQVKDVHFDANTPLIAMPNASFGAYYVNDKLYVGLSIPRLLYNQIKPEGWAVKSTVKLDNLHYYLTSGYVFNLNGGVKLKPTIMIKSVAAAPLEIDGSINAFIKDFLWVGLAYRSGDAISMLLAVQINPNLRVGYSYDYTTTKLNNFNSGSHELTLGYDFNITKKKIVSPRVF